MNTWTAIDAPVWYYNLSRSWKVQEIWEVWTVNLDFDVDNLNFDVPAPSIGLNYYYLYDSDNDNSLADETPQLMTNTAWSIWQIAWVDLNHLREFTIATQASSNNIPTDISISNNIINENITVGTTVWTLSTTDADSWDSHTYTFVSGTWDDDNSLFSILGNTLSINDSPDYEIKNSYTTRIQTDDWNGGQFQKNIIVNVTNIWEITDSIIDFENSYDENRYNVTSWTWTRNTNNPNEWSYSIESSNAWNNTQSCFEINHTLSATWTVRFDYSVSSQAWSDYLRFYIDNIEQSNWDWTVAWNTYTQNDITSWLHSYKWCYIKDWAWSAWTDNSWIDYITINSAVADITWPDIISINYASWSLLPWWNHNLVINYNDSESWISTTSDIITLNKWNGTAWGWDISATWLDLWSKVVTVNSATYPTNNLSYWKYRYNFIISDNSANSSSTWAVFYIDEVELTVSSWSINMWNLNFWTESFSPEIEVTVKTVWAWFDVIMNKTQLMTNINSEEIINYDWSEWFWYDQEIYSWWVTSIWVNENIATQASSININWEQNTYTYKIKTAALITPDQEAWIYDTRLQFWIQLNY